MKSIKKYIYIKIVNAIIFVVLLTILLLNIFQSSYLKITKFFLNSYNSTLTNQIEYLFNTNINYIQSYANDNILVDYFNNKNNQLVETNQNEDNQDETQENTIIMKDSSKEKVEARLLILKQTIFMIDNIILVNKEGIKLFSLLNLKKNDFSNTEYYKSIMNGVNYGFKDNIINVEDNKKNFTIAVPVRNQNSDILGIIIVNFNYNIFINNYLENIKFFNKNYNFILNEDDKIIFYYKIKQKEHIELSEIIDPKKADFILDSYEYKMKKGILNYKKNNDFSLIKISHIDNINWSVISTIDINEIFLPIKINIIYTCILFLIFVTILILYQNSFINKIVNDISINIRILKELNQGNININIIQNKKENHYMADLTNVIKDTKIFINKNVNSKNFIIDKLETYNLNLFKITQELNYFLSKKLKKIEEIEDIVKSSLMNLPNKNKFEFKDKFNNLDNTVKNAVELISEIFKMLEKTNQNTFVLQEISSNTNMLALNASIEASNAKDIGKDAGKGFTVVATQIRKLSNDSQEITSRMHDLSLKGSELCKNLSNLFVNTESNIKEVNDATKDIPNFIININENINKVKDELNIFKVIVSSTEGYYKNLDDNFKDLNEYLVGINDADNEE